MCIRDRVEGILITMTDERTNLSKKITQDIHKNFGKHIKIFDKTIPRCIKAAESTGVGAVSYTHLLDKIHIQEWLVSVSQQQIY